MNTVQTTQNTGPTQIKLSLMHYRSEQPRTQTEVQTYNRVEGLLTGRTRAV